MAKLLEIGKYYWPYKGGIETVVRCVSEGLAKSNDLEVLCSNTSPTYKNQIVNGVKIRRMPRFGVLFSQPLNFFWPIEVFRIFFRFKLIHIHSPNPLAEIFCIMLPGKQILITHHSDLIKQEKLKLFYLPIYKLLLKKAKYIIVPTLNHIKYSDTISEFRDKCKVIPFAIDTSDFKITESVIQEVDQIKSTHGRYFLFVGRLVGYKGLEYLITAMKKVDAKLIIVGEGPLREQLKRQVSDLNLNDKIIIKGHIKNHNTFKALYHGTEALVLPSISKNENFGMVQLEAMACSKPIICTNLKSGVPCVAEDGVSSIVVPPKNSEALALAMNKFLSTPNLSQIMGNEALKRFNERYTIDNMVKLHQQLIDELDS